VKDLSRRLIGTGAFSFEAELAAGGVDLTAFFPAQGGPDFIAVERLRKILPRLPVRFPVDVTSDLG
jgi:hypothetical protein